MLLLLGRVPVVPENISCAFFENVSAACASKNREIYDDEETWTP